MTVWILLQTAGFGGTEVHTLQLLAALQRAGHEPRLVCLGHPALDQQARSAGVTVHRVDGNIASDRPADWSEVMALFARHRSACDTLVIQKGGISVGSPAFLRQCRAHFRRLYLIEHSRPDPSRARPFTTVFGVVPGPSLWWLRERRRQRATALLADKVIAVSAAVRTALVEHHHYPAGHVVVVRNGVPVDAFGPLAQDKLLRDEPADGPSARPLVFGMVTRLSHVKGVDLALNAFALVKARRCAERARLVIFGEGEDLAALQRLAEALGLRDDVEFAGFVSPPAHAFRVIDVIVFSSRSEGLAIALLEGMAAGCVPIVTDVGGLPEVVDDPSVGYVVAPQADALADAMCSAAQLSPAARRAMRRAAVARVRDHFDSGTSMQRLLQIIAGSAAIAASGGARPS